MKFALYRCHIAKTPYQVSMPPLGLGYIGAYVKKQCWFCEVGFFRDTRNLLEWKPDIVGISSATENFNEAISLAKLVKTELGAPVFIGGDHITILPHTLPECFDAGIISEGEITAAELIKLYYKRKPSSSDLGEIPGICFHEEGKVVINKPGNLIDNLDILPYPDRDLLGDKWAVPYKKQVHMITSRGCPYDCIFCSAPLQWKKARYFSPEYVVKEIEYLRNRFDPEEIYFFDDLFIGHIQRFKKICAMIREKGLHKDIVFRSYGRVDILDESIADLFAELNFHYIDFGFEANSQAVLDYLNKKNSAPEKNQGAIDLLAERNISIGGNFIIGSPRETRKQMEETRAFVERNRDSLDRCSMGPLQPIPGTRVWEYAKTRGLVSEDMDWSRFILDLDHLDMTRDPYLCETMPMEEFLEFYYKFHQLAREINAQGKIRKFAFELERQQKREDKLRSELEELKGSRLVRLAMKFKKKR
ncbi:B12-binding domain-containing radical SAM protein [Candidatus Sumerlaeota bacterium]|nr:B12-binding domain-containing radical SAM protein [Candidatus Sumerlaeota bacterium]